MPQPHGPSMVLASLLVLPKPTHTNPLTYQQPPSHSTPAHTATRHRKTTQVPDHPPTHHAPAQFSPIHSHTTRHTPRASRCRQPAQRIGLWTGTPASQAPPGTGGVCKQEPPSMSSDHILSSKSQLNAESAIRATVSPSHGKPPPQIMHPPPNTHK